MIVALYVTLTTALYYLVSRAKVTEFAWSRYPKWLDYWTSCAACSGFWYGLGIAAVIGRSRGWAPFGLDATAWFTPFVVAATTMVWTPILARLMVVSWMELVIEPDDAIPDDPRAEELTEPLRILPLKPPDKAA